MNQDHGRAARDLRILEDLLQRRELRIADVARGDERGPRDRAREPDDGRRPAQLHAREAARRQIERKRGEVALDERGEVMREAPLSMDSRAGRCRGRPAPR